MKLSRDYLDKVTSPYLIAIDFDETLCKGGWPHTSKGEVIPSTLIAMQSTMRSFPTVFILWTCRDGEKLEEAKEWIADNDIPIFYFNEQHPSTEKWLTGYNSRKIFAHEYWDDRSIFMGVK